jgi:hypothetical protein
MGAWNRRLARHSFMGRRTIVLLTLLATLTLWLVPARICSRGADPLFDGDHARTEALARGVRRYVDSDTVRHATGSRRFDDEWLFGSHMMAAMGFGQLALRRNTAERVAHMRAMDRCLDRMLEPRLQRFDRDAWSEGPLDSLDGDAGHAAYLGYLNLALSLRRKLGPSRFDRRGEVISRSLERRIAASDSLLIETYPGEIYPVDNAAAVASIALHACAEGRSRPPLVARWVDEIRRRWMHPETALLQQSVAGGDPGRGSGTALAAYFLSYADQKLSRELYAAMRRELFRSAAGFGAMREYAGDGRGDIDSGPVLFGLSVSASGFALAGARIHGDRDTFRQLYATAHLFGAPHQRGNATRFVSGGAIGNAILFAMLTAPPAATPSPQVVP